MRYLKPTTEQYRRVVNERDLTPPDPPLGSGQLRLRLFQIGDAKVVAQACQDTLIPRFTFMTEGLTEDDAKAWIAKSGEQWARGIVRFAIVDRLTDDLVGQVGMAISWDNASAEGFFWIAKSARRGGVASSALGVLADWAFDEVAIERLYLLIHTDNQSSQHVANRCGFTREGVLRAYQPFKGGRPDMLSYSLLPSDRRPWKTCDRA